MAEFLVFNVIGITLLQTEIDERITRDKYFQNKYNARNQLGDLIEAREDDFGMAGKEPQFFSIIKVPTLSIEDAKIYVSARYEEITIELERPKLDYLEKPTLDFKYVPTITREYKVPTDVPELGIVDIDWVTLSGIVDRLDRRSKYWLDMSKIVLSNKEATLTIAQFNSALDEK